MYCSLHAFHVSSLPDEDFDVALRLMQKPEKKRVAAYVRKEDARRSTSGHVMLRRRLASLTSTRFDRVRFTRTREKKPVWVSRHHHSIGPCLNFNLSHSGDWAFCGIATHLIIGVDVQHVGPYDDVDEIPQYLRQFRKCFTWREWCCICLHSPTSLEGEVDAFLDQYANIDDLNLIRWRLNSHFVAKEAILKALGIGLDFDLKRLELRFSDHDNADRGAFLNLQDDDTNRLFNCSPMVVIDCVSRQDSWKCFVRKLDDNHVIGVAVGLPQDPLIAKSFRNSLYKWADKRVAAQCLQSLADVDLPSLDVIEEMSL